MTICNGTSYKFDKVFFRKKFIETILEINQDTTITDDNNIEFVSNIINNNFNNNKKKINLVSDKGYIKNENYIKQIKDTCNIILITPLRANSKKKIMINIDKEYENSETQINLLKNRFNVEKLKIFLF